MRGYLALFRATAKSVFAYRAAFALSLLGMLFQLVAMLAVWRAVLGHSTTHGFSWEAMRGYILVAFATGSVVGLLVDFQMAGRIQSGMVALDLVRPVRYQEARFAEVLGAVWIEVLLVVVVGGVAILTTGAPHWPAGAQLLLFLLSMILMVPLKFTVLYMCTMACFWTQNFIGVQWARVAVVNLFSGALIPLAYLPHWLGTTARWSPFGGLASTPGLIFVGQAHGPTAVSLLAVQLVWVVVLWLGAKALWNTAVKQLTVNGG